MSGSRTSCRIRHPIFAQCDGLSMRNLLFECGGWSRCHEKIRGRLDLPDFLELTVSAADTSVANIAAASKAEDHKFVFIFWC